MFFEKAQLLIPITKVTLRSLIFNQEPRYQGPSFSFVNETTSIQGPLFGVKHCCSSKSHRQTKIKKRFLRLDSLTKHEVRGSYAETLNFVSGLYNYREFSQPLECFYQAMYKQ